MTEAAVVHVYLSVELRYRPIWAVAPHLRPFRPLNTPDGFLPAFHQIGRVIGSFYVAKLTILLGTLSIIDAEAWPIIGEC